MKVVRTFTDARRAKSRIVALVPTMGYLHEGHLALVSAARREADTVLMSLFVNPLQFDQAEDLESYPRDLDRDIAIAEDNGVDVLFCPPPEEMYAEEPATRVIVPDVSGLMEGAHRPGHFEGVATVVAKLFAGLGPDVVFMGRKDAQQLVIVRTMARDLSFPIDVVGVPTVREADGIALSSRNVHITDRRAALSLSMGLFGAAEAAEAGERSGARLESMVFDIVQGSGAVPDYATLADLETALPIESLDRPAFLAVAATVGSVRLIDNVLLWPDGSADLGRRLEGRSLLYQEEKTG